MNAVQRATLETAKAQGRVDELFDELYRQIDRLLDLPLTPEAGPDAVPRLEHERIVRALNERIIALNAQLERKAS